MRLQVDANDTGAAGTYPASWYPIARSSDIKRGTHSAIEAFDLLWVVFRDHDGRVGLVQRHCCHMGADLQHGEVTRQGLTCPLHGWSFSVDGSCPAARPDSQGIKPCLTALPCEEKFGLVFAFYGDTPSFGIPDARHLTGVSHSRAYIRLLETAHHVVAMNTFDLRHFERVHNRRLLPSYQLRDDGKACMSISFEAEILQRRLLDKFMAWVTPGNALVDIDCWAGSLMLVFNRRTRTAGIVAGLPIRPDRCRVFLVGLTGNESLPRPWMRPLKGMFTALTGALIAGFLSPDMRVLKGLRPFESAYFDEADAGVKRYWQFYKRQTRYRASANLSLPDERVRWR